MKKVDMINSIIKTFEEQGELDTNLISDGCHSFGELYTHRAMLFSVICHLNRSISWKSKFHDDGTMYEGYFIVGINTEEGQATYHYGVELWDLFDVLELERAPKYDGHNSTQAIQRIYSLGTKK